MKLTTKQIKQITTNLNAVDYEFDQQCSILLTIMEAQIALGQDPLFVLIDTYCSAADPTTLELYKENIRKFGEYHNIPQCVVDYCLAAHFTADHTAPDEDAYEFDMADR